MNRIKYEVLNCLERSGDYISGERLSQEFSISRNMVNKYINAFKDEGYEIKSSRRGYKLTSKTSDISEYQIRKFLNDQEVEFEIYKTVSSTNTVAKKLAEKNSQKPVVIIASEQTEGRGRMGRSFFSPNGSGIYMSLLLRPDIAIAEAINVTTAAAVSVCRAIESVSLKKAQIKWVNDIFISGKKVCGILTEAAVNVESAKPEYVVLGIGINLFKQESGFPDEIKNIADSVFESKNEADELKNILLANVINFFFKYYQSLSHKEFYDEYRRRMFLIGKRVKVISAQVYDAEVLGVENDFSLRVKLENGEQRLLNSGEVSCRTY